MLMNLLRLFFVFLKIGAIAFGGGYGIVPVIRQEMLSLGWITDEKLLAVAEAATVPGETIHNMPFEVTAEKVVAAMKAADAYGRYCLGL